SEIDIITELYRLTEGDPLLVQLYAEELNSRKTGEAPLRVDDLRSISPKLDVFSTRWWDDQRRLWGERAPLRERSVQALLNIFACALGPLSEDNVLSLVPPEIELTHWTLQEALT